MLSLIHIENMAVIEKCEIEFSSGFNVLTGETGAGKSIIIDSISALLGQRISRDVVRYGNKKGTVLGVFCDIPQVVVDILDGYGLEIADDNLHIKREVSHDGKSVCRINMQPVTASVLKEIAPYLINIHGQHDGQKLLSDVYHVNFLDSFGENYKILTQYHTKYTEYYDIKKQLKSLVDDNTKIEDRLEYLKYLIEEIELADISLSEEDELRQKKQVFENFEKTARTLSVVYQNLSEGETNAFDLMHRTAHNLSQISEISDNFRLFYEKSEDIKYQIEELSSAVSTVITDMDFDADDIEHIEERLDLIYSIKRKYGGSLEIVLETYESAKDEFSKLSNIDKSIEELENSYKKSRVELIEIGKKLSQKRKNDAEVLEKAIISELSTLDMDKVKFKVAVDPSGKLGATGIDNVSFMIATNSGDTLKPLSKIASGGELSRIMLAIKNILSQNEEVGTLIFDEIDTGVSGRAGAKIARKLYDVAGKKQVLCVTHLASIAAMADAHYLINKSHTEEKTFTQITKMNSEQRKQEIARIIGGDDITDTSILNAEELISNAEKYKI
ncbi:MAG: DNA repair protein RecN [Clostridia bacterium]